jgi:uncharacterized protein YuzE
VDDPVPMRFTFDAQADAAYLYLVDSIEPAGVARTDVGADSTANLDFDWDGRLIGVEILHAPTALHPDVLRRLRSDEQ